MIWAIGIIGLGVAILCLGLMSKDNAFDDIRREPGLVGKWNVFSAYIYDFSAYPYNGPQLVLFGFAFALVGIVAALALFIKA